jgi:hypothetical protein
MFYGFIGDESESRGAIERFMCLDSVCLEFFYDESRRWSQSRPILQIFRPQSAEV